MALFPLATSAIEDKPNRHWVLPTLASLLIHALVLAALPQSVAGNGFANAEWRPYDLRHAPLLVSIRGEVTERTPAFPVSVPKLSREPRTTPRLDKADAIDRVPKAAAEPAAGAVTKQGIPGRGGDDCRVTGFRFCSS